MLSSLSAFSLLLLLAGVLTLVFDFLLPSGAVSETARSALTVLLLLCVFLPLLPLLDAALPALPELPTESVPSDEALRSSVSGTLEELSRPVIEKYTAQPFLFTVRAHTAEDGGIDISVVEILFDAEFDGAPALARELIDLLGVRVEVRCGTEVSEKSEAAGPSGGLRN